MHTHYRKRHQHGSALVVALILLVALTLMAIASMNTASLDLIMAGNEQYRSRAFHTAEAGVEAALLDEAALDTSDPTIVNNVVIGNDTYSYTVTPVKNGATLAPPAGSTVDKFKAIYFTIIATGMSARGATAAHTQEFLKLVPNDDDEGALNTSGSSSSSSSSSNNIYNIYYISP